MTIYVCGPRVYRYEDTLFEVHSYCGPWPLRKDGAPKAHAPNAFWAMWERFRALPEAEQRKYRIA